MDAVPPISQRGNTGGLIISCTLTPQDMESAFRKQIDNLMPEGRTEQDISFLSCPDTRRQRELEARKEEGSFAELFQVFKRASRAGWERLAVFDNLSKRQLSGKGLRPGELKNLSLVVIAREIKRLDETNRGESVSFESNTEAQTPGIIAMRLSLDATLQVLTDKAELAILPTQGDRREPNENGLSIFDRGLYLHDLDGRPFEADSSEDSHLMRDEHDVNDLLESRGQVPTEIIQNITRYAFEDSSFEDLTEAPLQLDRGDNPFVLLGTDTGSSGATAFNDLNEVIRSTTPGDEDQKYPLVIHRWKRSKPAARRDVHTIFERLLTNESKPHVYTLVLFDYALWRKEKRLLCVQWESSEITWLRKLFVSDVLQEWKNVNHRSTGGRGGLSSIKSTCPHVEVLQNPRSRFFEDPPPFLPLSRTSRITPPVFFLTNQLSKEDTARIKAELEEESDTDNGSFFPKEYCFVDWAKDEDGDPSDMWNALQQCQQWQGGRSTVSQAGFIDRQSAQDLTVAIADNHFEDDDDCRISGMLYGRIPGRSLTIDWCNLDIANMSMEDIIEWRGGEVCLYPRPDGQGPEGEVNDGYITSSYNMRYRYTP